MRTKNRMGNIQVRIKLRRGEFWVGMAVPKVAPDSSRRLVRSGVVERWVDCGDHASQFQTIDLAALKLLVQQFRGFGHAEG